MQEMEQGILALNRRKDGITAEPLQAAPQPVARQMLALCMKANVGCVSLCSGASGNLCTLAKRAFVNFSCDSFRSILLASVPGKMFHRSVRSRLLEPLQDFASPMQAGARAGIGVDSVSSVVRSFWDWGRSQAMVPGLLFWDLQAAYYRMLRQLVVSMEETEHRLCALLHSLSSL